jgi:hypothetical protein
MSLDSVLCKFQCSTKVEHPTGLEDTPFNTQVQFGGVWEGSTEAQQASENAIFGKWTPGAFVDLHLMNQAAADFFKPGAKYYVEFRRAPD